MHYYLQKHLEYDFIYKFITNGFPINFGIETETCNFKKNTFFIKMPSSNINFLASIIENKVLRNTYILENLVINWVSAL